MEDEDFEAEYKTFTQKIWVTKGDRFNAYRRLQRKQSASIFSISILSVYLMLEAIIPADFVPGSLEPWLKPATILASVFILILSLLEARKSYELKAERLHNNAMAISALYDELMVAPTDEKKSKIKVYHDLIQNCPENHEPCDDALFRVRHYKYFKVCFCERTWIKACNFIITYWLYFTLVVVPPLGLLYFYVTRVQP